MLILGAMYWQYSYWYILFRCMFLWDVGFALVTDVKSTNTTYEGDTYANLVSFEGTAVNNNTLQNE